MSLDEIKSGLADLPAEAQDQIAAYLVHLRHLRDPSIRGEITSQLDNQDPSAWLSLNELREKWKG